MNKELKATLAKIEQGQIASTYVIVGEDSWSRDKLIKELKLKLIDPSMADFNFEHLNAAENKGVAVVDKAGMMPMMAGKRMLVVDACDKWGANDQKALAEYLKDPVDSCCLVLCFESSDRRRKIFQSKHPAVLYLSFKQPRPWELPDYIRGLSAEKGLKPTPGAVAMIAEMAGEDLTRVFGELEKLSIYKMGEPKVDEDDVAALLGKTRHVTRWELGDFIGKRDLAGALRKAHEIMDGGEDPMSLLSVVNNQMKKLFAVKVIMTKGIRDKFQVAEAIGLPPKIAGDLMKAQSSYTMVELRAAFNLMRETDYRIKSVAMDRKLLIDHLLSQIIQPGDWSPPKFRSKVARG